MSHKHHSLIQTFNLLAGLKQFGHKGHKAAVCKMKQLHQCAVFQPIHINSLSDTEKARAMESLICSTEKHDGTIKGQTCANRSVQQDYMTKDEASSPTVMMESILITATLESAENRAIMPAIAFLSTQVKKPTKHDWFKLLMSNDKFSDDNY